MRCRLTSDLGDDVSSEHCVPGCFVEQVGGNEVDESLNLMHHGIQVGHIQPVLDGRDSAWPNHPVNFLMKFLCEDMHGINARLQAGSAIMLPSIYPVDAHGALDSWVVHPRASARTRLSEARNRLQHLCSYVFMASTP